VGFLRAAIAVKDVTDAARLLLVLRSFPRPMRCGEMQTQQEWHARPRVNFHRLHGPVSEQVSQVAVPLNRHLLLVELIRLCTTTLGVVSVIKIIGSTPEDPEESVVAAF